MKIPCAKELPFIVSGLSFLQPELTGIWSVEGLLFIKQYKTISR